MKTDYVICRDIMNKKYKIPKNDLSLRLSAYGLIFKKDKILLSKQGDGYDFPGGGVEKGELLEKALVREIMEETGIKVAPAKLVQLSEDFFITLETKRPIQSVLFYYLCKNPTGKISTSKFDRFEKTYLGKAEWVNLKDIKKIKFYNPINSLKLIDEANKIYKNKK